MNRKSSDYKQINIIIGTLICALVIGSIIWEVANKPSTAPEPKQEKIVSTTVTSLQSVACESKCKPTYTQEELFYMAATIYNEAGGDDCSDDTRRLVGYVVLNRVNDSRFPNTIKEVLEQKRQYGLFYLTGIKFADRHTLPQEKNAVERAYQIAREVLETKEIPIPSSVVFQAEFEQGSSIYKYQDGIYFCHL